MKINYEKIKKIVAVGSIVLITGSLFAGCSETAIVDDVEGVYDILDSTQTNSIEPQILDVPGEDFKLVVEYSLDPESAKNWTITGDKSLFTKVYTQGLPEGTKVYIDNVHTDTCLVAMYPTMNGIIQDSMDDRIHNSLMYGFPIADDTNFFAVNKIEGQNETFIKSSTRGFIGASGYGSSVTTSESKRYLEEDYLAKGVYGSKIVSAYGLLIQKGDEEPYGVDVSSELVVYCSDEITKVDSAGSTIVYQYDRDGSYQKVKTIQKQK